MISMTKKIDLSTLYKKKIRLTKIAAAISFISFFGWKKKKVEQLAKLLT